MKKTMLLCAILLLLLAGCKAPGEAETKEPAGTASVTDNAGTASVTDNAALKLAPEDTIQARWGIADFVETPDGYYYSKHYRNTEKKVDGRLLYFCPRGGDQFFPLCCKPNCMHDDKNCNAFFSLGADSGSIGYYNGALYAEESNGWDEYYVVKCNLDGTDRSVVATVPYEGCLYPAYHRGKFYFRLFPIEYDEVVPTENQKDRMIVVDLADGSQSEFAPDLMQTTSFGHFKIFNQNKAYTFGIDHTDLLNGKMNAYHLLECDLVTGKTRNLGFDTETTIWCADDSTLYWFESDKNYMGEKYCDVEPGFREYDLASGTIKNCGMPFEDANTAVRDSDYIYLMGFADHSGNNRTLYFLSKDYKLVDQIKLEGETVLAVAASDRVFVCDGDMTITGYIEKSSIGSGNLEVKPIQTVG